MTRLNRERRIQIVKQLVWSCPEISDLREGEEIAWKTGHNVFINRLRL